MSIYHYFYKITNNINKKYYYGVHNTNNLNDGYMGSGKALRKAYEKYGILNFSKEILKFFDTSEDAFNYERMIVNNDIVKDPDSYNIKTGGDGWQNEINKLGKVVVTDGIQVFQVDNTDERYLSGQLYSPIKGKVCVKDKDNNAFFVSIEDERYKSGELIPVSKGLKTSEQTKQKISNALKNRKYPNRTGIKCWVYKYVNNNYENKLILLNDLDAYLKDNWQKGRKTGQLCVPHKSSKNISRNIGSNNPNYGKTYVYRELLDGKFESKSIPKNQLDDYLNNGWIKGRKIGKTKRDYMKGKNYPSYEEICEKYNELKSWVKTAQYFGFSEKVLRLIRKKNN